MKSTHRETSTDDRNMKMVLIVQKKSTDDKHKLKVYHLIAVNVNHAIIEVSITSLIAESKDTIVIDMQQEIIMLDPSPNLIKRVAITDIDQSQPVLTQDKKPRKGLRTNSST